MGRAAAGARPDADGLEGAGLLPGARTTRRTSSTATATAAPPPGGTAGSSAAGSRTTTPWCGWCSARTSAPTAAAALDAEAERLTAWLDGDPDLQRLRVAPDEIGVAAVIRLAVPPCPPATSPSSRRRPSSGCGSATPSAAGSASPATATSAGPSSGRSSGPGCRWPTRRASTRTPGSRTPARRRPGRRARPSTSRSGWPRSRPGRGARRRSTRRCPTGSTCSRSSSRPGGSLADLLEASRWRLDARRRRRPSRPRRPSRRSSPPTRSMVERMTKKGLRDVRLPGGGACR